MALQPSLIPYLRNFNVVKNTRSFAAAAAKAKSSPGSEFLKEREDVRSSKANNIVVSSVETNKPLARLAVFFRAGSRFETDETQGVSQMLRIAAGLGTSGASQIGITRNIEQAGGNLYCSGGREYISYTLEASRDKIESLERYFADVTTNQVFKPWEVKDNVPRLRLERAIRPPEVRVVELIHKAAYRKGLGYSLYSPKWMLGNHTSEMLQDFTNANFGQAVVAAVGLPHEQVIEFASRLNLKGGSPKSTQAKYYGGSEIRKETNDELAHVIVAVEGAGISNTKAHIASALAQRILGSGNRTKRGLNSSGKLASTVVAGNEENVAATAFSASYFETGLLGVYVAAPSRLIDQAARKAADALLRCSPADEDVERARSQLKADVALAIDSDAGCLEDLGLQTLLTGKVATLGELNSMIESVSDTDVKALFSKAKLTMASYGNIAKVPHIDDLK